MTALALSTTQVARTTIAHHSKSFALASKLLGPRLRDQTAIVYTWCRRADDAVDEGNDPDAIVRLHDELDDAYARRARDPVLYAFGDVAYDRGLARAELQRRIRRPAARLANDARLSTRRWNCAGDIHCPRIHD